MSGWLPSAPCTPEACVTGPVPAVPLLRRLLRCAALAAVLAAGLVLAPLLRPRAPRARPGRRGPGGHRELPADRLVSGWSRLLLAALGVRIRAVGAGRAGAADPGAGRGAGRPVGGGAARGTLLVANHVSWVDVLLVAAVRPGRMLAKTEVRSWPLFGRLAAGVGTIFIERDRLRALPRTVQEIGAALRRGEHVVVFPEGSTWCGRGGGRFRSAAFQAALEAGAPVQPVTIRYRLADGAPTTAPAFVGEDGLLASLWRVVTVRGLVAELTLLPRIPAGRHLERRSLARAAQLSVQRCQAGEHRPGHLLDHHSGCRPGHQAVPQTVHHVAHHVAHHAGHHVAHHADPRAGYRARAAAP